MHASPPLAESNVALDSDGLFSAYYCWSFPRNANGPQSLCSLADSASQSCRQTKGNFEHFVLRFCAVALTALDEMAFSIDPIGFVPRESSASALPI